jgi:hypothetical protein
VREFVARLDELAQPKGLRALSSKIFAGTAKASSIAPSDMKPDDAEDYLSQDS